MHKDNKKRKTENGKRKTFFLFLWHWFFRITLFRPIQSYQAPQVRILLPRHILSPEVRGTSKAEGVCHLLTLGIVFDTQEGVGVSAKTVKVVNGS